MPERSASEAARRFVRDLRSLREDRGVSLDSLNETTRVPVDVLRAFETDALDGNRLFNRVYLRSLVRAYAAAIGFDADRTVLALEEALAGHYDGALLREPEPPVEETPEPVEDPAVPDEEPAENAANEPGPVVQEDEPFALEPPRVPPVDAPETRPAPPYTPPVREEAAAPPVVAWDAVSGSTRNPRVQDRDFPWGGVIAGVVVLVLVVAGIFWWTNRSPAPSPDEVAGTAPADTVTQQQQPAAPQPVALPDTLVLRVTATNGPVSDIKIQRDDDLRRPYWIEVGQSRDFPFTNRAIIERQLDRATIQLQGVAYPTSRTDEQGRLVITRDTVLALLQQR